MGKSPLKIVYDPEVMRWNEVSRYCVDAALLGVGDVAIISAVGEGNDPVTCNGMIAEEHLFGDGVVRIQKDMEFEDENFGYYDVAKNALCFSHHNKWHDLMEAVEEFGMSKCEFLGDAVGDAFRNWLTHNHWHVADILKEVPVSSLMGITWNGEIKLARMSASCKSCSMP